MAPGSEFPAEELGRTSNVWTAQRLPGSQYLQNTRIARPWLPSTRNTSTRAVQGFQQESQQSTKYLLPAYFKQLSGGVRESDVKYLGESGALTVPEDSLRNELLESFIDYVHGYAPVLDLQTFLETIDQTDIEQEGLSLLVFQAVMFAGTAYVDITHLLSAGFVSRRDARRVFFEKAKVSLPRTGLCVTIKTDGAQLLYQYNCEEDEISCIQALLLMSYWYENPDDPEHNWPWMTDALTLCEHMGLKYNLKRLCTDVKQQRLRKRIWWSCLMRERMVALGTGFPTHVNDKEYHASLLTLDDFDLTPLSDQIQCVSPKCAVARDIEKQRQLAIMCVNMSKLCLCIGKIIKAQYDVSSPFPQPIPQDSNINTIQMLPQKLVPKKGPRKLADIKKCDMELTSWLGELWEQGFYIQNTLSDLRDNRGPVAVHRAILYMVYFNAVGALHRPLIFSLRRPTVGSYLEKLCQASMEKVRLATSQITRIAEELDSLNLVQFLPAIAVTALMPAMVGHLLDIKSVDRCTVGLEGFCTCMAMLQYMRHLYGCADFAVNLLDVAIFKAAATVLPTDISLRNAKTKVQVIDLIKRAFVVLTPESLASTPFVPSNLLESQVDYLAQSLPFYMYSDPFEQLTDVGNV